MTFIYGIITGVIAFQGMIVLATYMRKKQLERQYRELEKERIRRNSEVSEVYDD